MTHDPQLADRIDALLPQTQCRQCGYGGCRPYAEALADGVARPTQCPPGGDEVAHQLAALLGVAPAAVDPRYGLHQAPAVAIIDEARCIGCTLCIQACPVDAIIGAAKLMHTVVARDCTGCELCMPPCPVACIAMVETGIEAGPTARAVAAQHARKRHQMHMARSGAQSAAAPSTRNAVQKVVVERAITRARARLAQRKRDP